MFIVISILIFGLIIAIHELGHFLAARAFGVGVPEFAIGLGPVLLKKQGKETLYTLRAIPLGGFCAMDGDDNDEKSEKSLHRKPVWQRFIIFIAGSAMNIIAGFLIALALAATLSGWPSTTLSGFAEGFPHEGEDGFLAGDRFHSINGHRIYQQGNISLFLYLNTEDTVDVVVIRDGARVVLNDLPLEPRIFGEATTPRYGFNFAFYDTPTFFDRLAFAGNLTRDFIRQLPLTIQMFASGQAGMQDVSSVVGIVDIMNQVGAEAENVRIAVQSFMMITALITIAVAAFNLLPIPALDGGRIFLMLVTAAIEKISGRKVDPKYEAYINAAGFALLIGFMIYIVFQDIVQIVTR